MRDRRSDRATPGQRRRAYWHAADCYSLRVSRLQREKSQIHSHRSPVVRIRTIPHLVGNTPYLLLLLQKDPPPPCPRDFFYFLFFLFIPSNSPNGACRCRRVRDVPFAHHHLLSSARTLTVLYDTNITSVFFFVPRFPPLNI